MQSFYIWRSPHSLLSCLPFSACVNGWDVWELDDLLVVLLLLLPWPKKLKRPRARGTGA